MLSVQATLPDTAAAYPPFVLVHGAANSAIVWTFWQRELAERGVASYAVDLRGHGTSGAMDLSRTSMHDYADDVRAVMTQLATPPVLMGWSMGGLAAIMAAAKGGAVACIGLAPSTPEAREDPKKAPGEGEYDATYYGITSDDPDDQPAMPDLDREERIIALASLGRESAYARGERARGIVVNALPCPVLIATGSADQQWPRSRYDNMPLPADYVSVEGASHWGLVLSRRTIALLAPDVLRWLAKVSAARAG